MKKILLITPEIGQDKGGIQNWMYFVEKLLKYNQYNIDSFAYKNDKKRKFFNIFKSDIFILATWKMSIFIIPILIKKKEIFIFVHGNEILDSNKIFKYLLKYLCKRKNIYFIANSNAIANLFFEETNRKIDLVQYPFMLINNKNIVSKKDGRNFFTITRLVKRKNIQNVIYAFHKLKREKFRFVYNIAGMGEEVNNLKKLVQELKLEKEIHFMGKVSEEEKEKLYKKSNYFLLPSLFDEETGSIEGYGIVFIEANSYKIPVLSGNTGGMIEAVIDNTTGLHSDGSIDDIYNRIKKLVDMDFDYSDIYHHAKQHDYLKQDKFLDFFESKIND